MFDIDQDVEILAVIQAANQFINAQSNLVWYDTTKMKLDNALVKLEEKYGSEIFTYKGV